MPSSSIPVPIFCIGMTLRSLSFVSLPVFGFFCSSTCASSLYVIADAAATWRFMKKFMSNGCWKIVTPFCLTGSIPNLASAAKTSYSLPPSQFATVLPFIFATLLIPVSFHEISVSPLRVNTCAMLTRSTPLSRVDIRLGSQSIPNCAWPPATAVSGMMSGPPGLIVTSRPICR